MKGPQAEETEHRGRFRPAKWIVATQVALSLVLVLVAGLFLQSFWKLATLDPGFDRKNILLMNVNMHNANVPEAQRSAMCEEILNRLRVLPGVMSVGQSVVTPISGMLLGRFILPRGANTLTTGREAMVFADFVSPDFAAILRTPMLSGRDFTEDDAAHTQPVAIINQTMARKFFPGDDPVGKYFATGLPGQPPTDFLVIGIVKDAKFMSLRNDFHAMAFFPAAQMTPFPESWNFEIRTGLKPSAVEKAAGAAVESVNKAISLQFSTLEQQVDDSITQERLLAVLSVFFGGLAVLLAMIGLYGVLSYIVTQRKNEIGIRMALGASRGNVVRLVLRDVAIVLFAGCVVGILLALETTKFLTKLLFGVQPHDLMTLVLAVALLTAAGLVAGYIPARRASRLDPMAALREE